MSLYYHGPREDDLRLSRRQLLRKCGMGMGALALTSVLAQAGLASTVDDAVSSAPINPLLPKLPPFAAKPMLAKFAGKALPMDYLPTERKTGSAMPSPFKFKKYGKSGIEISELFPHVGEMADELCVIRSMHADVPNHEPSLLLMNCGEARMIRPSVGSWLTYGLGSENQNLPGFVVMCPGGYPIQESQNWQSGFLPGVYQGTYINTANTELNQLIEHIK